MGLLDLLTTPKRRERMMQVSRAETKMEEAESRLFSGLDIKVEDHEAGQTGEGERGGGADEESRS